MDIIEKRNLLLSKGYFPEILPPCFESTNLARCFKGMIRDLEKKKYHQRTSGYVRYSGTKHDGNRRYYGTVNPIPYFHVCQFISKNWELFRGKIDTSDFSLGGLNLGTLDNDRALLVLSLSEVTNKMASKIKFAPYIIKTDVAQFFPSIYTHSLCWVAHGIIKAKADTSRKSNDNIFNNLDWFVQQCQRGQTRGVIVGPDAFRILAEYIASEVDHQLIEKIGEIIIGGVRHVDDFYIGVKSEMDASIVLSQLREILQNFELQVNDSKTKVLSGLQPIDDIWAQELRGIKDIYIRRTETFNYLIDKAFDLSLNEGSQSPMKLVLRRLDKEGCYKDNVWIDVEPKLQRILFHFPHCIDYLCLLVAKRKALKKSLDVDNWKPIIDLVIDKAINANHHHEIVWLIWLCFVCEIPLTDSQIDRIAKVDNSHIKSILIAGSQANLCKKPPSLKLGNRLSSDDENWLHNLVARSTNYSKAKFTGEFAKEFEFLVQRGVKLIDFNKHMMYIAQEDNEAISNSKYGYDSSEEEEEEDNDWGNFFDWD